MTREVDSRGRKVGTLEHARCDTKREVEYLLTLRQGIGDVHVVVEAHASGAEVEHRGPKADWSGAQDRDPARAACAVEETAGTYSEEIDTVDGKRCSLEKGVDIFFGQGAAHAHLGCGVNLFYEPLEGDVLGHVKGGGVRPLLPIDIGELKRIGVSDAEVPYPKPRKRGGVDPADPAEPRDRDARLLEFFLMIVTNELSVAIKRFTV